MAAPSAFVFDILGTLFSLEPIGARLREAGLPEHGLKLWFARLLRDAFALEAAGAYVEFREVAAGSLEVLLTESGVEAEASTIDAVLDTFSELPPFPDVKPALELLRDRGVPAATLGNGSAKTVRVLLERAGLAGLVDRAMSVEEVRHWKPHPAPYLHAARTLGVSSANLAMVAAHGWDIAGARRAGLRTGWVSRTEKHLHPRFGPAEVTGATVKEVVEKLLGEG